MASSDAESERGASTKPKPFISVARGSVSEDKGCEWLKKEEYGQVPQYLIDRRLEMAAAYAEEQVGVSLRLSHSIAVYRLVIKRRLASA